ncbi:hypothetical protein O181_034181 [Austropuccinia psidii MF-1]|uniref:DUF4939 domain-containing protein n=1 Tax=Austropuccinia psidii MF-1 TaxID=1389203 RepID=A0A9Q3D5V4_9BASI|nr:hypothetical protein [Austropuccinia psidii MF-1]
MPVWHSPPERQTRSQATAQAVLTPTQRVPLDRTPAVPQLRAQLDREPHLEGEAPSRKTVFKGPCEFDEEEEENSVEEEESYGTEGVPAPVGASKVTVGPTIAQYSQTVSHQSEPFLLAIMKQMTKIMANLQEDLSSETSRPPAFNTHSMKAPECFHGTQPFKVRSFIQYFQLIFQDDLANFSQDRSKSLYATSFLIGRAEKWIEPYLSILTNQDPTSLLNSWKIFESQLSTLSLVSRIGDWGGRALIHYFRKGFPSRILDQLASNTSRIHSLQDLMNINLELDTRYHGTQKEKGHHQEKKPEASKSNSSHPQNSSSSSQQKKKNFQKRDKPHSSLLNKD